MSKISLKHSGGNVVSLNSPTSAPTSADVAFKLPNADGTSGQALVTDASGNLSFASVAGGKILQVVQTVKTDSFSSSSGTLVDITGFSVSITPSSNSNKILVSVCIGIAANSTSSLTGFALLRDSTNLTSNTSGGFADLSNVFASVGGGGTNDNDRKTLSPSIMFLDSPNTTSATTYKVQMLSSGGSTGYFNQWGQNTDQAAVSTITVMEVAA